MRLLLAPSLSLTLALTLAACGEDAARAPGAISEGEAKALDAAAAMLDQRRLPPEAIPPENGAPEEAPPEQPAAELTGDTAQPARR